MVQTASSVLAARHGSGATCSGVGRAEAMPRNHFDVVGLHTSRNNTQAANPGPYPLARFLSVYSWNSSATDSSSRSGDSESNIKDMAVQDLDSWQHHSLATRPLSEIVKDYPLPKMALELQTYNLTASANIVQRGSRAVQGSENTRHIETSAANPQVMSNGSLRHAFGHCTPCRFTRRRGGCRFGFNCIFCHYPHEELTSTAIRNMHRVHPLPSRISGRHIPSRRARSSPAGDSNLVL